ncbi:MAG: MoaD/ThiS family protein [Mycobacterium sp.]
MTTSPPAAVPTDVVHVRFFAAAKAEFGSEGTTWEVPRGTTIETALVAANLHLSAVIARCSFLVNGIASRRNTILEDNDDLDVLPPFAGG